MTDAEIIEFAREFRDGILNGRESVFMCFAVCAPLTALLSMHGVENEMIEVDLGLMNHVFLRLPDGRVLDPTMDQFDYSRGPVYLGDPTEWHEGPSR